jgi:hypothetical protein
MAARDIHVIEWPGLSRPHLEEAPSVVDLERIRQPLQLTGLVMTYPSHVC